jgi:SAM-dependent methyltransferase
MRDSGNRLEPVEAKSSLDPVAEQRRYYAETAADYDEMHGRAEHIEALDHALGFLRRIEARTVLDTGCGTGLAMRYLAERMPELELRGNDPSPELLAIASERYGISPEHLDQAESESLPYGDGSFDAVVETGVLHHVPDPDAVIREMLRVARMAIFISDDNTFGLGKLPARVAKLGLSKAGMLDRVNRRRRGGHDWYYTPGDGVAWSYSVLDSLPMLREACAEVVFIPTGRRRRMRELMPRLFASHGFVGAFKQPLPP